MLRTTLIATLLYMATTLSPVVAADAMINGDSGVLLGREPVVNLANTFGTSFSCELTFSRGVENGGRPEIELFDVLLRIGPVA